MDAEGEVLFLRAPVVAGFLDGANYAGGTFLRDALGIVAGRDDLPLGSEASTRAGELRTELRRGGNPLPMIDVRIATMALEHHHVLVNRDSGFTRIPGPALDSY